MLGWTVLQTSEIRDLATRPGVPKPDGVLYDASPMSVAEAFFAFYQRSHQWDPVAADKGALDILASHVSEAAHTLLVQVDGAVAAVGCMWPRESGWEFSGGACLDASGPAVAALLDAASAIAAGAAVLVEVDSDMAEVHQALAGRRSTLRDAVSIMGRLPP